MSTSHDDTEMENTTRIPVSELWDGVLLLSLSGVVDSVRSYDVMDGVLREISETRARIFILDIRAVAAMDTAVANHLIKITQAATLLGCECVISGISPSVAQALVQLGIPLKDIVTRVSISDALRFAFDRLELQVVPRTQAQP
ncbi:STAS domain-containing protein [Halomonas aquatica]|uniref:STAS domain-containing protein n=1 Tax=Halomonas aquatica TaxID=3151123 RepID=A0ABV1NBE0_9GAMM